MNVERILSRCIEDGDCLLWQGPTSHSGVPVLDTKAKKSVRRALWEAERGAVSAKLVFPNTCGNMLCVCHTKPVTLSEARRIAGSLGAYKSRSRVVKRTLTQRAQSKYDEETVKRIKAAASAKEAQEQTGASLAYIYQIREGYRRAPLVTAFTGLGAR